MDCVTKGNYVNRKDKYFEEKDGKWYFWNETWSHLIGGYPSREEAEYFFEDYLQHLKWKGVTDGLRSLDRVIELNGG